MATTQRDQDISERLLAHAEREYANGDITQAINKAWDALAHCVNAIAVERGWPTAIKDGWPSDEEAAVRENTWRLLDCSSDPDQNDLMFASLEVLHVNYFDYVLYTVDARLAIDDAKTLIEVCNDVNSQTALGSPIG